MSPDTRDPAFRNREDEIREEWKTATMAENRTSYRSLLVAGVQVAGMVGIVVSLYLYTRRPLPQLPAELLSTYAAPIIVNDTTIHAREGWAAEDFFSDPDVLRAANAIVKRDGNELQSLVDAGLDVNLTGKAGTTLLFWAFVTDNLDAFKLLLTAGADPDMQLSGTIIPERTVMTFPLSSSVLFSSLKASRADFFLAALEHTKDVNQRLFGDTFLHICAKDTAIVSTRIGQNVLQPLIDAGIDLNARDRYGCTAAYYAADRELAGDGSVLCLRLLEAGADPDIPSNQGDRLADRLARKLERYRKQGLTQQIATAERVKEWLESHRKPNSEPR
jgi:ankyrin repeat protein